jgi:hypothetical protein
MGLSSVAGEGASGRAAVPTDDAYLELRPGTGAPPNGGTANVGDRFVLELWVDAGSHDNAVGQQTYMSFTHQLLQNARVSDIDTGCTLASTVTGDFTTFDAQLQNQVCNGPGNCTFGGNTVPPGSLAFASGALNNPPVGGQFRVARIGICAVAPGEAVLHWQFSPPDPPNRNTKITDEFGGQIENRAIFLDYTFTVLGAATATPTATSTATNTSTSTPTPIGTATHTTTSTTTSTATSTATDTATSTPTNVPTNTPTGTPTNTPTSTETSTPTPTRTLTSTPTPSSTSTATHTPSNTVTSTATNTPTVTNTSTATSTSTSTSTVTPTASPTCTLSPNYQVSRTTGNPIIPASNLVPGSICNGCVVTMTLPFPYTFYDQTFSAANVSPKGTLQFVSANGSGNNLCLPTSTLDYAILSYWDDFQVSPLPVMGVFTDVIGTAPNRTLVVEWRVRNPTGPSSPDWELLLYEGQERFDLVYRSAPGRGQSATIGAQEGTGQGGQRWVQWACDTPNSIQAGDRLIFDRPTCP